MNRALAAVPGALALSAGGFIGVASLTNALALNTFSFLVFTILLLPSALRAAPEARAWLAALRRPHVALRCGTVAALTQRRILLLIAMFASTALAVDSVLPLAPVLAYRIGGSGAQPRYFLLAIGFGAVLGSLRHIKDNSTKEPSAIPRNGSGPTARTFPGSDSVLCEPVPASCGPAFDGDESEPAGKAARWPGPFGIWPDEARTLPEEEPVRPRLVGSGDLRETKSPQAACRRAALSLLILGTGIVVFAVGMSIWVSLTAAVVAGMAAVEACAPILDGLAKLLALRIPSPALRVGVMMLWVVAWVVTEPLASFMAGWLVQHFGLVATAVTVALPVIVLSLAELSLSNSVKRRLVLYSELISRWAFVRAGIGQDPGVATALQADPRSWGVTWVAAGLAGFAARLTGDPSRYHEEFRSELYDLAAAGKGRCAQAAHILRLFLAAGSLRVETSYSRRKRAS